MKDNVRTLRNDNQNAAHDQLINALVKTVNQRKQSIREMDQEFYCALTTPEIVKSIRKVVECYQDRRLADLPLYAKEMADAIIRDIEESIIIRNTQ